MLAALVLAAVITLSGCLGSKDEEAEPEEEQTDTTNADAAAPQASRDPVNIHMERPTHHEETAETETVPTQDESKGLLSCKTERSGLLKLDVNLGSIGVDVCV